MPRGKLNRNEKYIIAGLAIDGYSALEIAEETGRSLEVVERYLDTMAKATPMDSETPLTETTNSKKKNKGLFVRRTAAKGDKGVSIITEAESTRSEQTKGKTPSKIVERFRKTIHQIYDDD